MNALDLVLLVVVGVVISSLVVLVINAIERNKDAKYLAMLEEAHAMNDAHDEANWFRDEAEAFYANDIVHVVGYCLCKTEMGSFKPFKFTTVKSSAENIKFLDMIACSHCPVCNPDVDAMLAD
jgi:hypothetical protein